MNANIPRMIIVASLLLIVVGSSNAQIVVTNDITTNTTWTNSNEYILDGLVFVDAGITLTIEAGTIIKARESANISNGDGASALIVRRDAQILANGTADEPIVFTSELDDVNDPDDLIHTDRGLWGGVILLGNATTNQPTTDNQIEGIASDPALYGGIDDGDSSGILRYVSIRHGGFSISGISGDEINGLTMGGVGSGTVIEYVEVYANLDDCYEWFGGTVNTKWLVGAFCADDTFDYDQGFRGNGQFWFSLNAADESGRAGEHDGGDAGGDDAVPFSIPMISNATYIGSGVAATPGGDGNDRTFAFRDNAGGKYYNSIFTDFPGVAIDIEDLTGGADSRERLEQGDLAFNGNIFFGYGGGNTFESLVSGFAASTIASTNEISNPLLGSICRTTGECLDARPNVGSPAFSGVVTVADPWFDTTSFRGAFGKGNWLKGWTALDKNGYLGDVSTVDVEYNGKPDLPSTIVLAQNYPNPFNPSTSIRFVVSDAGPVTLAVYDMLGKELTILIDRHVSAGPHSIQFSAGDLPTGMYIYRLRTSAGVVSRTMVLMK